MIVNTAIWEWEPTRRLEYHKPDAVAFQIIDTLEGDSARGHFQGDIAGTVRPKLDWHTECVGSVDLRKPVGVVARTG